MSKLVYSIHVELRKKGDFYVTVPALPGCWILAKSFNSALNGAKKEIEKHLLALAKAHKHIPIESQKIRPLCLPIRVVLPKSAKTVLASELKGKN